jgi:formylglycine-generating enzyme required for sulfatase activity
MLRIPGGRVAIGLPREEARFYNEQPRFDLDLPGFWIDARPVGSQEYSSVIGRSGVGLQSSDEPAINVSYRDASRYCSAVGKRLPTEFEWETAAQHEGFLIRSVSEWTSSWYQPYPGNNRPEKEYGTLYRVVRGYDSAHKLDLRFRSFMGDQEESADVGFRCAEADKP